MKILTESSNVDHEHHSYCCCRRHYDRTPEGSGLSTEVFKAKDVAEAIAYAVRGDWYDINSEEVAEYRQQIADDVKSALEYLENDQDMSDAYLLWLEDLTAHKIVFALSYFEEVAEDEYSMYLEYPEYQDPSEDYSTNPFLPDYSSYMSVEDIEKSIKNSK